MDWLYDIFNDFMTNFDISSNGTICSTYKPHYVDRIASIRWSEEELINEASRYSANAIKDNISPLEMACHKRYGCLIEVLLNLGADPIHIRYLNNKMLTPTTAALHNNMELSACHMVMCIKNDINNQLKEHLYINAMMYNALALIDTLIEKNIYPDNYIVNDTTFIQYLL